jgi:tetrahydromethanopterin S-methyltransferase subunit G
MSDSKNFNELYLKMNSLEKRLSIGMNERFDKIDKKIDEVNRKMDVILQQITRRSRDN